MTPIEMDKLPPATVIAVRCGLYEHVGLVSDRLMCGIPTVISNSKRQKRVVEEPLAQFCNGKSFRVICYPGHLSAQATLRKARSALGRSYDLFSGNCEHFVTWAYGTIPQSPQLRFAVALGLAGLMLWISVR